MSSLPHILVLGSLNMDLVAYVPHHPLPGETLTATSFTTSPGGKGANQAVACAKLSRSSPSSSSTSNNNNDNNDNPSAHVSMIGAVGQDHYGAELLASLASYAVDATRVRALPAPAATGTALVVVDAPTGENRIVLAPGANHALRPSDFPASRLLAPPAPDLLVLQLEIPLDTVVHLLRAARAASLPVLLNPAPVPTDPTARLPSDVYRGLAHLVVNETEAAALSGCELADLADERGLGGVADRFLARGVRNLVVTLGARGVYYATGHDARVKGGGTLVPAQKVDVVDTTAAGDTFVGSYALSVVGASSVGGTFDIDAAVRSANKAAAVTVSRRGAQVSIPWRNELQ